uniref:S-adenosylmethionine mitochondrial carrier protein n=1 Tax=Globodera rostochiensis TaxID=31243 RepID=A0A914H8X4_GLORO
MEHNVNNGVDRDLPRQIRWLLAGASAGLAVDLSLYPLDTIKTRMQSKAGFKASGGFRNIYRGVPAVAIGSAPGSALFFITYYNANEVTKRFGFTVPLPLMDALSATFGELVACLVRVPTEIVKQRSQTSPSLGLLHIGKELYRTRSGIRGFYKGYASTIAREIPFSFIEFPLWEFLKRQIRQKWGHEHCTPLLSAACGSLAGLTAAALTTPFDVLKTRVMLDRSRQTRLIPTAVHMLRNEGINCLFAGVLPRALWMGAGGFIFFFAFEASLRTTHLLF